MPGTAFNGLFGNFYGDELTALVKNETVSEARLDDMVGARLGSLSFSLY
jgi:beta-glucosidase